MCIYVHLRARTLYTQRKSLLREYECTSHATCYLGHLDLKSPHQQQVSFYDEMFKVTLHFSLLNINIAFLK